MCTPARHLVGWILPPTRTPPQPSAMQKHSSTQPVQRQHPPSALRADCSPKSLQARHFRATDWSLQQTASSTSRRRASAQTALGISANPNYQSAQKSRAPAERVSAYWIAALGQALKPLMWSVEAQPVKRARHLRTRKCSCTHVQGALQERNGPKYALRQ